MFFNILKSGLYATTSFTGIFLVFGLIINQLQKTNVQLIYSLFGKYAYILTGFIGTTVHEFSHYVMCLIFGHSVTDVSWFRPLSGMQDGVLGYVNHSYNPNSIYQQIGNFFIGIAPMIVGTLIVIMSFKILMPNAYKELKQTNTTQSFYLNQKPNILKKSIKKMDSLLGSLLKREHFKSLRFWAFLFIVLSITSHMSLSLQDIKGATSGLFVIYICLTVLMFLLKSFGISQTVFSEFISNYNSYLITFLSIGVSFSLIMMLFLYAISFAKNLL